MNAHEKRPLRYSLINRNGKYLYCDGKGGGVIESDTPIYLDHDPVDWQDLKVSYERDISNFGVYRSFTLPTTWHGGTAQVLRHVLLNEGFEAFTTMKMEAFNTTLWDYEPFATAEIDYTQFHGLTDDEAEPYCVKINLMDNSISEFIKANEGLTGEVALDGRIGALTLTIDGIEQKNGCKWLVSDGGYTEGNTNPAPGHCLNTDIVIVDGTNRADVKAVVWYRSSLITDFIAADRYIYKATAPRQFTFDYNIIVTFGAVSGNNYSLGKAPVYVIQKWDGTTVSVVHTIQDFTGQSFLGNTFTMSGSYTAIAAVGDEYYISVFIQPTPAANEWMNFNYDPASWISLKYYDRLQASTAGGMRYHDVYKNLLEKQSDGAYTIISDFLRTTNARQNHDNEPFNTVLSPAESIRGRADAKIKTSLNDLRQFGRANWMLGQGIEGNKLRVEPLTYFFKKDDIILTVESIGDFKYYVARDMLCSGVRVGYEPQSYDAINGADEFNTLQQYKLPVNRVATILDLVSPIRADIYGIEQVRAAQFVYVEGGIKETASTRQDNTLFAIELNDSFGVRRWPLGLYQFAETGASTYNTGITPKRGLIRNLPHIYSILPRTDTGTIKLTSTANQGNLRTLLVSGETINENTDMQIQGNIFAPQTTLFKPIYFEFECKTPANFFTAIFAKPYGVIKFRVYNRREPRGGSHYLKGFIVSVEAHPNKDKTYVWKLLSTPDNDLSFLINM